MRWMVAVVRHWLDRAGVIAAHRLKPTLDLAWPRTVTGLARKSKPTADTAMVGLVLGPAAIAGLAFGYAYWRIGNRVLTGFSGGTLSLVSQSFGADEAERTDLVLKQSVLAAAALSLPFVALFYFLPRELVALVGNSSEAIGYGAAYLEVLAPALLFESFNKVSSRALAGVDDTFTPMVVRSGGAVVNIVINAVLIFGLGLGIRGAALGTAIAAVLVSAVFLWMFARERFPGIGPVPIRLRIRGQVRDRELFRQLVEVSVPLIFRKGLMALVGLPLLAIVAVFGPVMVAAFEIARRARNLGSSISWGVSTASSSLVGQFLGDGDEREAEAYALDILRLTVVANLVVAAVLIVAARPIAGLFTTDPATVAATVPFVWVAALGLIAYGSESVLAGSLRGAGDTRWPFYATLIGLYGFTVPIAYLGVVTPIGVPALYLALFAETAVPAAVNFHRFRTDRWKVVSRKYRPNSGASTAD